MSESVRGAWSRQPARKWSLQLEHLVVFDLDDTLIRGQSQRLLLTYLRSKKYIGRGRFVLILGWFVLYKIGLARNPAAIMARAFDFLRGRAPADVAALSRDFFDTCLKELFYEEGLALVARHKAQGHRVILVSNAVDFVANRAALYLGAEQCLSTQLEIRDGRYTGSLLGPIMYGARKAQAVADYALVHHIPPENVWAYADHLSDSPLLESAGQAWATNPSKRLLGLARQRGWHILSFGR